MKAIDGIAREIGAIRMAHEEIAEAQAKAAMARGVELPDSSTKSSEVESEASSLESMVILSVDDIIDLLRAG